MNAPQCNWQPVERHRTAYNHLETDDEFIERLRKAGHVYITARLAYRRPGETLAQFRLRTRLHGELDWEWYSRINSQCLFKICYLEGQDLDDKVWDALKMQRRIVEVVP